MDGNSTVLTEIMQLIFEIRFMSYECVSDTRGLEFSIFSLIETKLS